jgi:hypothetical protein
MGYRFGMELLIRDDCEQTSEKLLYPWFGGMGTLFS